MSTLKNSAEAFISPDMIPMIIGIILALAGLSVLSGKPSNGFGLELLGAGLLIFGVGGVARIRIYGTLIVGTPGLILIIIGYLNIHF
jgi:hypothetical protein